ncbi:hypothetical protein [Nitrosomonas eutropha]|uniref:Uncharacterized protein n=1 Tax=Nitrosomonas eutropha TaxID=916 RepID=A0ABX5M8N5_9PROT|nr:hypothetical protein [Nitrosomonas eutropha]PXV81725.1 hypothetical protein C8R14_11066 [Nitrosomonas eutropha]SEI71292.1 hypothetical protein SAMN05216318_10913 [Nitrosomonas eutropha]
MPAIFLDPIPLADGEITITPPSITELLKTLEQDPEQVSLKSLNAHAKFSSDNMCDHMGYST